MSPTLPPDRAAATPAASAARVAATSRSASGLARPTRTVSAASPWNPPTMAPKSSPTTSPSRRRRLSEGMPWTTSSFTEMQTLAG